MSDLRARFRHSRQRGYTLVELMMALALFVVAVLGIIAMQKITAATNGHVTRGQRVFCSDRGRRGAATHMPHRAKGEMP